MKPFPMTALATTGRGALPAGGTVLDDVVLHPSSRVLLRRRGSARAADAASPGPLLAAASSAERWAQEAHEGQERGYRDGLDQGRSEGYAEGYARGHAEGTTSAARDVASRAHAAEEDAQSRLHRLDSLAHSLSEQFAEELRQRLRDAEADMVAVAHAAVCRLVGEQALEPGNVVLSIRRAIEQHLGTGSQSANGLVSIHVHPDDLDMLRGQTELTAWLAGQHGSAELGWQADAAVRLGGCIVRGSMDSLDATLDAQLEALHTEFTRVRAARPAREALPEAPTTRRIFDAVGDARGKTA